MHNKTIVKHGFCDIRYITFTSTMIIPGITIITFVVWVHYNLGLNAFGTNWKKAFFYVRKSSITYLQILHFPIGAFAKS